MWCLVEGEEFGPEKTKGINTEAVGWIVKYCWEPSSQGGEWWNHWEYCCCVSETTSWYRQRLESLVLKQCPLLTATLSSPESTLWTYKHKQKFCSPRHPALQRDDKSQEAFNSDAVQERKKEIKGRDIRWLNKEAPLQTAINDNDAYWTPLWLSFPNE